MTYGRRHFLTQLVLVRLAYAGWWASGRVEID